MISVCGKFVFHRVIREEVYRSVRCGGFEVYVILYIGVVPKNKKVKIVYASITFVRRVKFYVFCTWFTYLLI